MGSSTVKAVRAGTPIVVDDVQVIPVERTEIHVGQDSALLRAVAVKKPVAIVICSRGHVWAVDLEGREISLQTLLSEAEGLHDAVS